MNLALLGVTRFMVGVGLASCGASLATPGANGARDLADFEKRLEHLRLDLKIPAYSAAITNGTSIVWARGFGLADVEAGLAATPTTEYHLASLTKTFASTILLQLVDEGKLSLDDPVSKYGIDLPGPGIVRVRHLMSHTSEGVPGSHYSYNGARFGLLDSVIVRLTGSTFAARLQSRILQPLALPRTAPNPQSVADFSVTGLDRTVFISRMAKPYALVDEANQASTYPVTFGTAAGLVSTALDYARYSIAMDTNAFLKPETRALAFTPTISTSGDTLPYGLGWFTTRVGTERVVWHYGYWVANSSLVIKVPSRGISFVIMANSDMLSRPTRLGAGDLLSSRVAREFIDAFVLGSAVLPTRPIADTSPR